MYQTWHVTYQYIANQNFSVISLHCNLVLQNSNLFNTDINFQEHFHLEVLCSIHKFCAYCYIQSLLLCGKHSWYLCHTTPTSPTNSVSDLTEGKLNPITTVFLQGWQLLSLASSLFLPKQSIMWHLKVHLQRNADPRYPRNHRSSVFCPLQYW